MYEELEEFAANFGDEITSENVSKLKYLEYVFKETSRLFPPLGFVMRRCTKRWRIPETNFYIDEGEHVYCSTGGVQARSRHIETFVCISLFTICRNSHGPRTVPQP